MAHSADDDAKRSIAPAGTGPSSQDRTVWVTLVLVLLAVLLVLSQCARALDWTWSGVRLTPTFAWADGLPVYGTGEEPIFLTTIYPPLAVMVYWPATLFREPSHAIVLGAMIAASSFTLPILVWSLAARNWGDRFLVASVAMLIVMALVPLRTTLCLIHGDAPALGLAALAAWIAGGQPSAGRMFLFGLAAAASIWSKQTTLPLLGTALVWILVAQGGWSMLGYLASWGTMSILLGLAMIAQFGWEPLWFNLIELPSQHGFKPASLGDWASTAVDLGLESLPLVASIGFVAVLSIRLGWCRPSSSNPRFGWDRARDWLRSEPWTLPMAMGLVGLPLAVLTLQRIGGSRNHESLALYFLLIAWLGQVAQLLGSTVEEENQLPPRTAVRALLLWVGLPLALLNLPILALNVGGLARWEQNPHAVAYRFAKQHPGEVLFPWHGLSTYLAEGQLYPLDDGVYVRTLAGYEPLEADLRRQLPTNLRWILIPARPEVYLGQRILPRLPEFQPNEDSPLPGWKAHTRQLD